MKYFFDIIIMQCYSLPQVRKLPPVEEWLNPDYTGYGDMLFNTTMSLPVHIPENFETDFSEYVYQLGLEDIKTMLNKSKSRIDPLAEDGGYRYSAIIARRNPYNPLCEKLLTPYGAEGVNNAWLKFYECADFINGYIGSFARSRTGKFVSMHFAEAPGGFILALNHFLASRYPSIEWRWWANTHKEDNEKIYLGDHFGLIKKYPQWIFGAEDDGDITNPANIRTFSQKLSSERPHLVTADVKYVPPDNNYDEEERINLPAQLGQVLCTLMCLAHGGYAILKMFTLFEAPSISLLQLLCYCFAKVDIVKPRTSKPGNSEIYLICGGYKDNLTTMQKDRLLSCMGYLRHLNTDAGSPALFKEKHVNKNLYAHIYKISWKLAERQTVAITADIEFYMHHKNEKFVRQQIDGSNNWIEDMKLKKIDKTRLMLK